MAEIERRGKRYRVRWTDIDGRRQSWTVGSRAEADRIARKAETARDRGERWHPQSDRPRTDLGTVMNAYIVDRARVFSPQTLRCHAAYLDVFARWLEEVYPHGTIYPDVLSKGLLADFYASLAGISSRGRPRADASRQNCLSIVQRMWAWAANEDEYAAIMPPPRKLEIRVAPGVPTVAPTWAEVDACIAALGGEHRRLALLMRFTGLRVRQVLGLQWADFDLGAATLRMRGELGKTRAERRGRIVPVSPHLVAEMATWGVRDGWVIEATEGARGRWLTMGNDRVREAWKASGVRPEVWRGRPHHAFRKALVSGLIGAGAQREAVEYLVGHSLGLAGVYTDPEALGLREAVGMVPAVGGGSVVDIRSRGAK